MIDGDEPAILFVCLGNICRSPLAEAAFRAAAERAGLAAVADSAGTGDWHAGKPPDPRAQAVALRYGLDISGYRARQLAPEDFHRFTHVLALDPDNLKGLRRIAPRDARACIGLLMNMVPGREGEGVKDPYFGGDEGFEDTWRDVTQAAQALVERLMK